MPNNIKNLINMKGDYQSIKSLFNKYNTHVRSEPRKSFDGDLTYINNNDNNSGVSVGWLNEKTNVFKRRNQPDCIGVPDGFIQDIKDSYDHFPDFQKIITAPDGLDIPSTGHLSPLENKFSSKERFKDSVDSFKDYISNLPEGKKEKNINEYIRGIKNYITLGYATWYTWNIENWGTKWNSYSLEKISETSYMFETAWSCARKLIEVIAKENHEVEIEFIYADEDSGSNCGIIKYSKGCEIYEFIPKSQSVDAYDIYFSLNKEDKLNYKLINGAYEYIEE